MLIQSMLVLLKAVHVLSCLLNQQCGHEIDAPGEEENGTGNSRSYFAYPVKKLLSPSAYNSQVFLTKRLRMVFA